MKEGKDDKDNLTNHKTVSDLLDDRVNNSTCEEYSIESEKVKLILLFLQDANPFYNTIKELEPHIIKYPAAQSYVQATNGNVRIIFNCIIKLSDSNLSINDIKNEIHAIKKQLNEIVFESFSTLQYSIIDAIETYKSKCQLNDIKEFYKNYYDGENHHYKVATIQELIHSYKDHRDSTYLFDAKDNERISIAGIWKDVYFLIDVFARFKYLIPDIEKYGTQEKKEANNELYIKVLVALLPALIAALLSLLS